MYEEEDQLFLRVLMVVLTVAGGFMSAVMLAPAPLSNMGSGLSQSGQFGPWVRVDFSLPSRGHVPSMAPVQTGESGAVADEAAPPVSAQVEQARRTPAKEDAFASLLAEPAAALSLDLSSAHPSPAALQGSVESVGEMAGGGGYRPAPAPRVDRQMQLPVVEQYDEDVPLEIRVPDAIRPAPEPRGKVLPGAEEDALPEFRSTFLPRAQECARRLAMRSHQGVEGKATLRFTVGVDGWVTRATVLDQSMRDEEARSCLLQELTSRRLFSTRDEPVTAQREIIFTR